MGPSLLLFIALTILMGSENVKARHHTSFGAPFGVPSHGSTTFLTPDGANSLASIMTALGIATTPGGHIFLPSRSAGELREFAFSKSAGVSAKPSNVDAMNHPRHTFDNTEAAASTSNVNTNQELLRQVLSSIMPSGPTTSLQSTLTEQTPFILVLPNDSNAGSDSMARAGTSPIIDNSPITGTTKTEASTASTKPDIAPVYILLDTPDVQSALNRVITKPNFMKQNERSKTSTGEQRPSNNPNYDLAPGDMLQPNQANARQKTIPFKPNPLELPPFPGQKLMKLNAMPMPKQLIPEKTPVDISTVGNRKQIRDILLPPALAETPNSSAASVNVDPSPSVNQQNLPSDSLSEQPVNPGDGTATKINTNESPTAGSSISSKALDHMSMQKPNVVATSADGSPTTAPFETPVNPATVGVLSYVVNMEGSDGINRHESGQIHAGHKTVTRSFVPLNNAPVSAVQGVMGPPKLVNINGNYTHTEPSGKVFRLQYSHGDSTTLRRTQPSHPPALQLPYGAIHPVDFLLKKITAINGQQNERITPIGGKGQAL